MIAVNAVLAVSFGLAVQLGHAIGRYHVAMLLPCCLTTLFVHCRFTFGSAIWPFGSATWPRHWVVLFGCFIGRCGLLFGSAIGHVVWLHHWWCGMSFGSAIWPCHLERPCCLAVPFGRAIGWWCLAASLAGATCRLAVPFGHVHEDFKLMSCIS